MEIILLERVAKLGAGIALGGDEIAGLGGAVRRVIEEPSYRATARSVASEVAALPRVDEAPEAVRDWMETARAA